MIKTIDTRNITDIMLEAQNVIDGTTTYSDPLSFKDAADIFIAMTEAAPAVEPAMLNTCLSNAKQEPAQSAAEPVGYISGWINGHLAIRLLDPALALSTGTALFLQPPTVPPVISEPVQAVPYGWHITGLSCLMVGEYAEHDAKAAAKRCGGTTKAIPLYTAPPAIDETQQRTLDFVRWVASLKTGGLIQARANDLLSMLEAGDEN